MVHINRTELCGEITDIRIIDLRENKVANIALCVSNVFRGADGELHEESLHFRIEAFNHICPNIESLKKGDKVQVIGRLLQKRYIDINGNDNYEYIVKANFITPITEAR